MDHVKTFRAWESVLNEKGKVKDRTLATVQEFDSIGRPTKTIKGTDTLIVLSYSNGFWAEAEQNGSLIQQELKLDERNNLIYRKSRTLEEHVVYDDRDRPIEKLSELETWIWSYEGDLLVSFSKSSDREVFEQTTYTHDTVNSTLSYTCCQFSTVGGQSVTFCDSVYAELNAQGDPTYVLNIDNSWNEPDSLIMSIEYDEKGNVTGGFLGCERIEFEYNPEGYRMLSRRYDCENKLVYEQTYEYELYAH